MDYKNYVDLLSAALTPAIGITTTYIAIQQYRTNKIRLRHELYERRVEIFRGVLALLSAAIRQAGVTGDDLVNFTRSTSEKEFLFDDALCQYTEEIYSKAVKLWSAGKQLDRKDLPVGPERTQLAEETSDLVGWLLDQLPEVRKKFSKSLSIVK